MKSIMQEASSVVKAIEKAWESAGKPKEFSIKIFEEPKRNFIGMTVHSAKVGIFFSEKALSLEHERTPVQSQAKAVQRKEPATYQRPERPERQERPERHEPQRPQQYQEQQAQQRAPRPEAEVKTPKIVWSDEMLVIVNQWLSDALRLMNLSHVSFTLQPSHYQLNVSFNKPLVEHEEKEQQLLRNFSMLLIQTMRHKLKRPLRGFKIMMTRK